MKKNNILAIAFSTLFVAGGAVVLPMALMDEGNKAAEVVDEPSTEATDISAEAVEAGIKPYEGFAIQDISTGNFLENTGTQAHNAIMQSVASVPQQGFYLVNGSNIGSYNPPIQVVSAYNYTMRALLRPANSGTPQIDWWNSQHNWTDLRIKSASGNYDQNNNRYGVEIFSRDDEYGTLAWSEFELDGLGGTNSVIDENGGDELFLLNQETAKFGRNPIDTLGEANTKWPGITTAGQGVYLYNTNGDELWVDDAGVIQFGAPIANSITHQEYVDNRGWYITDSPNGTANENYGIFQISSNAPGGQKLFIGSGFDWTAKSGTSRDADMRIYEGPSGGIQIRSDLYSRNNKGTPTMSSYNLGSNYGADWAPSKRGTDFAGELTADSAIPDDFWVSVTQNTAGNDLFAFEGSFTDTTADLYIKDFYAITNWAGVVVLDDATQRAKFGADYAGTADFIIGNKAAIPKNFDAEVKFIMNYDTKTTSKIFESPVFKINPIGNSPFNGLSDASLKVEDINASSKKISIDQSNLEQSADKYTVDWTASNGDTVSGNGASSISLWSLEQGREYEVSAEIDHIESNTSINLTTSFIYNDSVVPTIGAVRVNDPVAQTVEYDIAGNAGKKITSASIEFAGSDVPDKKLWPSNWGANQTAPATLETVNYPTGDYTVRVEFTYVDENGASINSYGPWSDITLG